MLRKKHSLFFHPKRSYILFLRSLLHGVELPVALQKGWQFLLQKILAMANVTPLHISKIILFLLYICYIINNVFLCPMTKGEVNI